MSSAKPKLNVKCHHGNGRNVESEQNEDLVPTNKIYSTRAMANMNGPSQAEMQRARSSDSRAWRSLENYTSMTMGSTKAAERKQRRFEKLAQGSPKLWSLTAPDLIRGSNKIMPLNVVIQEPQLTDEEKAARTQAIIEMFRAYPGAPRGESVGQQRKRPVKTENRSSPDKEWKHLTSTESDQPQRSKAITTKYPAHSGYLRGESVSKSPKEEAALSRGWYLRQDDDPPGEEQDTDGFYRLYKSKSLDLQPWPTPLPDQFTGLCIDES